MGLIKGQHISFYYITEEDELGSLIDKLKEVSILGLDTETKVVVNGGSALDPHTARIRLIQLNWLGNDHPYVIDVDRVNCMPLIEAIQPILKVIHNAQFDLKMFYSTFGIWLENVRCSMTAMKSLSVSTGWKVGKMRGHSLKALARDHFDIDLDKAEASSDWGIPILSLEQLEYAAMDVMEFLIKGYLNIQEVLTSNPPLGYGNSIAFEIEQNAVLPIAKLEYKGMYTDPKILRVLESNCSTMVDHYKSELCQKLGFPTSQTLEMNEDGELEIITSVSKDISRLLNNNKDLVKYVNQKLKGINEPLDNLQADALEALLDYIDTEDEESEVYETSIYNKDLIQCLLSYKKYAKLLSDVKKYLSIINPTTGCIHTTFHIINAGTSRMASSEETTRCNLQQINKFGMNLDIDSFLIGGKEYSPIKTYMSLRNGFTAPSGYSVCISDFGSRPRKSIYKNANKLAAL